MVASSSASRAFCPPDRSPTRIHMQFRRESEPAETGPQRCRRLVGPQAAHVVDRRLVGVQLVELVLRKVAHAQLGRPRDAPAERFKFPRQKLGKRGFSLAITAQQGDPVVLVDAQREAPQDRRAAVADAGPVQRDDRRRQLFRLGEGKHVGRRLLGRRDRLHPRDHLQPRLRLARLGRLVAEAVDVGLQVRAACLLLARLGRQNRATLGPGAGEGVVRTLIKRQFPILEVQDRAHGPVQQAAVVGNHDDRVRVAGQVGFQPERALEVEVVRGLVQQQQVGLREEDAGQRHAHPPAAREGAGGHRLLGLGKAQALENAGCPALGGPGVDVGEAGLDLGDAGGVGGGLRLAQQLVALGVGGQHRLHQRGVRGRRLLRDAAHAGPLGARDRPALERKFATYQPEKRGLSRAVPADEADLVAARDDRARALEERPSGHGEADVVDPEHGRHVPARTAPVKPRDARNRTSCNPYTPCTPPVHTRGRNGPATAPGRGAADALAAAVFASVPGRGRGRPISAGRGSGRSIRRQ